MPKHSIENTTSEKSPATSVAGASVVAGPEPDQEAIAELAHRLWKDRGRPEGSPEEDWYRAEDLLRTGRAVIASSTLP
jgi:hypothetical protein